MGNKEQVWGLFQQRDQTQRYGHTPAKSFPGELVQLLPLRAPLMPLDRLEGLLGRHAETKPREHGFRRTAVSTLELCTTQSVPIALLLVGISRCDGGV